MEDCRRDLDEAAAAADNTADRERVKYISRAFEYNEVTMEAIWALKKVEDLGVPKFYHPNVISIDPHAATYPDYWIGVAKSRVIRKEVVMEHSERLKPYLEEALAAVEERWRVVDELRDKGVITHMWLSPDRIPPAPELLRELIDAVRDVP